jgi:hypothetical protein
MQFRTYMAAVVPATLFLCFSLLAQSSPVVGPKPGSGRLIVYGQGFVFGVKEPQAWRGTTGQVASNFQANIVFFPSATESQGEILSRADEGPQFKVSLTVVLTLDRCLLPTAGTWPNIVPYFVS